VIIKTKRLFWSVLLLLQAGIAQATCLPVAGLTFEKIDYNKLLVIRGGKNIGILNICGSLPKSIAQFRFFNEKICDTGAEDKFHIDGQLFTVCRIEFYSQ
jgi:hypothetical protein